MSDEKDRLGQKLHDVEQAREDQWARERDRELMEKMRQRQTGELHCPQCNGTLTAETVAGFAMMSCPNGHGAWLDKASVDRISRRG